MQGEAWKRTWEYTLEVSDSLLQLGLSLGLLLVNSSLKKLVVYINQLLVDFYLELPEVFAYKCDVGQIIRDDNSRDTSSLCLLVIQLLPSLGKLFVQRRDLLLKLR